MLPPEPRDDVPAPPIHINRAYLMQWMGVMGMPADRRPTPAPPPSTGGPAPAGEEDAAPRGEEYLPAHALNPWGF